MFGLCFDIVHCQMSGRKELIIHVTSTLAELQETWEEAYHHPMNNPRKSFHVCCDHLRLVAARNSLVLFTVISGLGILPVILILTCLSFTIQLLCIYAHNELEMAAWRSIRHLIGKQDMKEYFHYFPVSSPEGDQDDRNMLYYLRWNLKSSALFSGSLKYLNMAKETMRTLIVKFPGGYEDRREGRGACAENYGPHGDRIELVREHVIEE
ncbi:uncharacterized protein EAE98_007771 [Botrytis deweyae]|uniref:Uncharacterized protein n=1 Tax=Botrytis deweyae TaxID=2478750 RepID=A0ABQ7IFY7_9HELO|nr:uncharacterized protein EAE98_007771 [Botrytis deweyae]KAF7923066.1 hypothetical protein EAE98_007771 [Botrytis deweyae]